MTITRREFLRRAGIALKGAVFSGVTLSLPGCAGRRLPLLDLRHRRVLADLHVHAGINEWIRQTPLAVKYPAVGWVAERFINKTGMDWKQCHKAGIDLICATHFNVFDEWLSMPTDPNPLASANTHRMMDQLEEIVAGKASSYARIARNRNELRQLLAVPKTSDDYRIAVVHTIEGGHALGGDLKALESFSARGVAMMTLTHFFNKGIASAVNSFPFFPDANSGRCYQGLSEFGRDVLQEMERLGMIVDVIHATSTAIEDILKLATRPVVASHSSSRTLGDHPYSLLDEHIVQIARDGGLIGIIIDPYLLSNYASLHEAESQATLRDFVRTVRYVVKLCGTHAAVGIGSDFAGYISGPVDMSRLSQIDRVRQLLLDEFGNENVVEDIMANNVIDFMLKNWGTG